MGYVGIPLSLITIAGLPIIIGLGMDFSLQFHNRYEEELSASSSPALAATGAISHMGKAVGMAVGIMSAAFLTLIFVEMPMIQHFGIVLAIGVCIIYLLDITLLVPLLTLRDKNNPRPKKYGHETIIERGLGRLANGIIKHSVIVLLIPVLVAGVGYSLDHSLTKESELEKLMPQNAQALVDMNQIRDVTGTTMALQWMIEADDVTDPNVVSWISKTTKDIETKHEEVSSVQSIVTLIEQVNSSTNMANTSEINNSLAQIPPDFQQMFVSEDHKMASLSMALGDINASDVPAMVEQMQTEMNPPKGVTIKPVGSQYVQIQSLSKLTDSRDRSMLLGLAIIIIGLFIAYRSLRRSLLSIIPILLVIGWSTAALFILNIPLNPLTAVLGSLILGIGTEFVILFLDRYEEECTKGLTKPEAIVSTMKNIGRAITASALTVVGGFSALIFTNFEGLKGFGVSTVIDALFCLLSTLIVLPAVIMLFDKRATKSVSVNYTSHTQSESSPLPVLETASDEGKLR